MNDIIENKPTQDKNRMYVMVMYALFALAVFTGTLSAIAGAILAYVKRDSMMGTIYYDHARYLIKTFWAGLAAYLVGLITVPIVIGMGILFVVLIWYVYRLITGFVKLTDHKTVRLDTWF